MEGFQKAMTGGACAPGGQQTMGNNAMNHMIDQMLTGGAMAQQKAEGYQMAGPGGAAMAEMDAAFASQDHAAMMNQEFERMHLSAEGPMQAHPSQMDQMWEASHSQAPMQAPMGNPPMMSQRMPGQGMGMPMMMNPAFSSRGPMHAPQAPAKTEEPKEAEEKTEEVKEAVPTVQTRAERVAEMEKEVADMEQKHEIKPPNVNGLDPTGLFQEMYEAGEFDDEKFAEIQKDLDSINFNDMFNEDFENEVLESMKADFKVISTEYDFKQNNPYSKVEGDLFAKAQQLNEELKVDEALDCLQAHLQKNPDHINSWRMLGQLHQERDEDDKAILCLSKAHACDPFDLDTLLYLGISCSNEIQKEVAMKHLENWLRHNPAYSQLDYPQHELVEMSDQRMWLNRLFMQALQINPKDDQLLQALGVLKFIDKNYQDAEEFFKQAIKLNPTDHTLWNKYGAALANHMNIADALPVYHQALELRPNLVRTWCNLGFAYSNRKDHREAFGFFLNGLSLNPEAVHIWDYLKTQAGYMKDENILQMVTARNFDGLKAQFNVIDPTNLPQPQMDKLFAHPLLNE